MEPDDDDQIVASGDWGVVEYLTDRRGKKRAKEYMESLISRRNTRGRAAALFRLMQRFADYGTLSSREHFKVLNDHDLLEFKTFKHRLIGFFDGEKRVCLTHGFKKDSEKTPPSEIRRAERLRDEYREDHRPPKRSKSDE